MVVLDESGFLVVVLEEEPDPVVEDEPPRVVVVLEVDSLPLGLMISIQLKSDPARIDTIKISDRSFNVNLVFIKISLFLYLIPILLCGAFRFVIAKGVIGFIFQVVRQILLLYEMIFIIVRIFVSLIQG